VRLRSGERNLRAKLLIVLFSLFAPNVFALDYNYNLLPTRTISAPETGLAGEVFMLPPVSGGSTFSIAIQSKFLYGAGGTSVKAYVQTSLDAGSTWIDIASFAYTTSAATKVSCVKGSVAVAAALTPTDGTLTDNTILDGLIGDRIRVKWTSVGTYTGATSLAVSVVVR